MPGMEDDVKDYLRRIVWSFSIGLVWLMLNMTLGIYNELMFVEGSWSLGNIIFYIILLSSTIFLIWIMARIWKKKFPHG